MNEQNANQGKKWAVRRRDDSTQSIYFNAEAADQHFRLGANNNNNVEK
jgi:hypothetical protein